MVQHPKRDGTQDPSSSDASSADGSLRLVPTDKPSDPADKGVDQFQPVHRTGYGDKYSMVFRHAKLGHSLAASEGRLLTDRIESLEAQVAALESKLLHLTEGTKATRGIT